jgi:microcin C transport system permease protein
MFRLDPLTKKKLKRFRSIKRGYYSFIILITLFVASLFAELWINNKALIVRYDGQFFFPTYSKVYAGSDFGLDYSYEVDYRDLQKIFRENSESGNWVLMPPIPYSPFENVFRPSVFHPIAPNAEWKHFLGTDTTGRDILARLVYGFRTAMLFAIAFTFFVYLIGIIIGCAMGYFGGWVDLLGQRMVEIWSNIPFLYMVIIMNSLLPPGFPLEVRILLLLVIMVAFSWTGMTYFMRTGTYKEKARDYTAAAILGGAGSTRIIFTHILPNILATLVTLLPFTIAQAIVAVTALDFLGFGLPPPTPSIGELLRQGTSNFSAGWIVGSAFATMVVILTLVTFIGEAVREAFDPKKFTVYQ